MDAVYGTLYYSLPGCGRAVSHGLETFKPVVNLIRVLRGEAE
jgi:hypothetical protein